MKIPALCFIAACRLNIVVGCSYFKGLLQELEWLPTNSIQYSLKYDQENSKQYICNDF